MDKGNDTDFDDIDAVFRQKAGVKGTGNKYVADAAEKRVQQQQAAAYGMLTFKIEHPGKIRIAEMPVLHAQIQSQQHSVTCSLQRFYGGTGL